MKALLRFFRVWLLVCFVLAYFVVPFYLVAIYPEVPEPYYRFMRSMGYGVLRTEPSPMAFAYRFVSCGLVVAIGMLIVWKWLRDTGKSEGKRKGKQNAA